ncbi:hypothetical protein BCL57_002325 [Agromyces flavus]|uniref:Uncharacterized protein n=1 Tax=Agromyces flavus TaxID=589382 RepID=A0A1H1UU91_9MICO|nr:hypothetical protein [Agromyces flavus]MCP2368152.1 hypothetical protein [Agromyces flavus]GGI47612.1 hypothetical protein GCM10010932_23000 [Agromyces flavus]SDS75439.1 hypothetical protein SAMN04489721_1850 [Agromyces flavus]
MTDPPRPPERRSPAATAVVAVVVGVLIAAVGHQLVATELHRQLWPSWVAADARHDEADAAYDQAAARAESAASRTESLEAVLTPDLVGEDDRTALADALVGLRSVLDADAGASRLGIVDLVDPDAFAPAWELYADLWEISELVPERAAAAASSEAAAEAVLAAADEVDAATETLITGAQEVARAELAANPSATTETRRVLEQLVDGGGSGTDAAAFTALATAVADVRASHAAEVARAEAYPVRAEIEAFARSIANGVALDFAWAYEVAGLESDTWYSGTAEFGVDGGEWGLITLSESIEWAWGDDPNAEAVVVHEVGHTQVIREACRALFEQAGSDHESWATAWAIGMGYDLPGSGIEAYGRPTDAQVAAAAQCR